MAMRVQAIIWILLRSGTPSSSRKIALAPVALRLGGDAAGAPEGAGGAAAGGSAVDLTTFPLSTYETVMPLAAVTVTALKPMAMSRLLGMLSIGSKWFRHALAA